jgi:hypothetical protein
MSYTVLQLVLVNDTGDSCYRMRWPARELAAQDVELRVINLDAQAKERFEWALEADLLVMYQSLDLDLLPVLERRRAQGKRTLVEYNDDFYDPPPWSPVAREWNSPLLWESYERFMEAADGIIVTGPGLLHLFSARFPGKPIHVLENHLPEAPAHFDSLFPPPENGLCLAWAGSLGHIADFLSFVPSVRELLERIPDLSFHVMGNESIPQFLHLPPERVRYTPWGTMEQYYAFWKPVHIGFAPLLDTGYNRCRSDIKAVEMAGIGVLPLLTKSLPYEEFCRKTGVRTFASAEDFRGLVLHYASDRAALRADAARCHKYVSENRVGPAHRERLDLYHSLLPKAPSAYAWSIKPGYAELRGTPAGAEGPARAALARAQAHLQGNKVREAVAVLEDARRENPRHPEIALSLVKCLSAARDARLGAVLAECRRRFPRDLRFSIAAVAVAAGSDRRAAWHELVSALASLEPRSRLVFEQEAIRICNLDLVRDAAGIDIGRALAEVFPNSCALRLTLAEALERTGHYDEALKHFRWLEGQTAALAENQGFLTPEKLGYVTAWRTILETRTAR